MTKIAIVDIETTGPRIEEGDQIIQIAAVIIEAGGIIAEHNMLINPETEIPYHIVQLTGITQEEVSKAPTFKQVASLWYERLKDCYFVAHNLALDLNFLSESFASHGNYTFQPIALDTVKLAKILIPQAEGFNLTDLSEHFGFQFRGAHDALADAQVTTQIVYQLAMITQQLSDELKEKMLPFVEALPHDEAVFFTQTESFLLEGKYLCERQNASYSTSTVHFSADYSKQLGELVLDQSDHSPYLVVEDPTQPISSTVLQSVVHQLIERDSKFCLAVTRLNRIKDWKDELAGLIPEEEIVVIKASKYFVHQKAFEHLVKHYNFKHGNQQEYLIIAATLNWLSLTQKGDYDELNQELVVQSLLVKYSSAYLLNQTHAFYHQMIKRSYNAKVILTDHRFLVELTRYYEHVGPAVFQRFLLVDNLNYLNQQVWHLYEDGIPISHWFTQSRLLLDHFNYSSSENESWLSLKPHLTKFTSLMHELLQLCQHLLKSRVIETNQTMTVEHYISPSSSEVREIAMLLQELEECHQRVIRYVELERAVFVPLFNQYNMNWLIEFSKLKGTLHALIFEQHQASYWVVRSEFIQSQYYHIQLIKRPLVVDRRPVQYLKQFDRLILLSPGNYYPSQQEGTYQWLQLFDFSYYTLPKLSSSVATFKLEVPVEYMPSPSKKQKYQHIALFLEDELHHLNDQVVILVNSKAKGQQLYRELSHSAAIKTKYVLLGQGVSGSLRKIKRKALEMKPAIIIMSWSQLLVEQWSLDDEAVTVLIDRLPFDSPLNTLIQAKGDYLGQDEESVFHQVLLPSMVHNLKMLTSHLRQKFLIKQFYLFDDRVFTKYYANTLQEELEFLLKFEIRY